MPPRPGAGATHRPARSGARAAGRSAAGSAARGRLHDLLCATRATGHFRSRTPPRSVEGLRDAAHADEAGRAQASASAAAIAALGIRIGEAIASPICRTIDTARLIAGDARPDGASRRAAQPDDHGRPHYTRLDGLVATAPAAGTNRIIIGQAGGFERIGGPPLLVRRARRRCYGLSAARRVSSRACSPRTGKRSARPRNGAGAPERSSSPDPAMRCTGRALARCAARRRLHVYFRHTATDLSQQDRPSFEADRLQGAAQPLRAGRTQAARIGEAFKRAAPAAGRGHREPLLPHDGDGAPDRGSRHARGGGAWPREHIGRRAGLLGTRRRSSPRPRRREAFASCRDTATGFARSPARRISRKARPRCSRPRATAGSSSRGFASTTGPRSPSATAARASRARRGRRARLRPIPNRAQ